MLGPSEFRLREDVCFRHISPFQSSASSLVYTDSTSLPRKCLSQTFNTTEHFARYLRNCVQWSQLILQNLKGGISRACRVMGRIPPANDVCVLHRYVCAVAPRYKLGVVPQDNKQLLSLVQWRFRTGVFLTGREAWEFTVLVARDCILPLPFHLPFFFLSNVVVLLYASDIGLPLVVWQAWGKTHVYLLRLIMKYAESGSTATLYFHGLTHVFGQPHLPIPIER